MNRFKSNYGPWALVAGASEGLGAAFAVALAQRGLNLVLVARRQDKLDALAQEIKAAYSVDVEVQALDLADHAQTKRFATSLQQHIGLLVYNAAYAPIGNFEHLEEEALLGILDVNVKGPLLMAKWLSSGMVARKKGGIVLMSSLAGFQGSPKIATYAASKAFNRIFAEGLWHEMKQHGVDVLACSAGAIRTPGYQQAQGNKEAPGTLDAQTVADQTLNALGKGPSIIPGWTNRLASFLMSRLLPRKTAISMMHQNTKNLS